MMRFKSKDGLFYASYQEMVAANVVFNEKVLQKAGLDQASFEKLKKPKHTKRRPSTRRVVTPLAEPRRSSRKRNVQPENQGLPEQDFRISPVSRPKKQRRPKEVFPALPESKRRTLARCQKWLDDMETYLIEEENLSRPNYTAVMRQVEKLVRGEGITYSRWDDSVKFRQGEKVRLSDDFLALFDQAVAFEDEHGRDLGNGKLVCNTHGIDWHLSLIQIVFSLVQCQAGYCATLSKSLKIFNATTMKGTKRSEAILDCSSSECLSR